MSRAALGAAALLLAGPGLAAAAGMEVPKEFQGRWVATGLCDPANDVRGGLIQVGPTGFTSYELACTFTDIHAASDPQNRRLSFRRSCESEGKTVETAAELYLVESEPLGDVLVSVNADGSFLTLYKRCNGP